MNGSVADPVGCFPGAGDACTWRAKEVNTANELKMLVKAIANIQGSLLNLIMEGKNS